ncbi:MAG: FHA domain-containing protein, partial [Thermoguttaceae bacterium]|nr:FHA domain-containing protein [Thermoguttaceae bacterium]
MDSLFVIKGNDQGRRYTLDDSVITIGRDSSNKIRIHDPEVSRRHAKITFRESERVLVDLDSANGIFVNGKQVRSRVLVNNDQIRIGKTVLLFASYT